MPFTNIETVRLHLSETGVLQDSFRDVSLQLSGTSAAALTHSNLKSGSVSVKGKEIGAPVSEEITLAGDLVNLTSAELIPDSVVVAADSSLSTIYTENVDYHVDYQSGVISRIASGNIQSGSKVVVWYYRYKIHSEGDDYLVNYTKGTVSRRSTGSIEDGQVVFVDYQTQGGVFDDAQIGNAITEADNRLLNLIDASYHNSTNQSLITAATYLTIALLCRIRAFSKLDSSTSTGSAKAENWLKLADRYQSDALALVTSFNPERGALRAPMVVKGGGGE